MIILDNSPASYIFHTANAVPVSSWFNDPHDSELLDLIPFFEDLAHVDDVTDILDTTIPGPFSHLWYPSYTNTFSRYCSLSSLCFPNIRHTHTHTHSHTHTKQQKSFAILACIFVMQHHLQPNSCLQVNFLLLLHCILELPNDDFWCCPMPMPVINHVRLMHAILVISMEHFSLLCLPDVILDPNMHLANLACWQTPAM